jgi:hypothetical protein
MAAPVRNISYIITYFEAVRQTFLKRVTAVDISDRYISISEFSDFMMGGACSAVEGGERGVQGFGGET